MDLFRTISTDVIAWVYENRTWLFSGIGVLVVGKVLSCIVKLVRRRRDRTAALGAQNQVHATHSIVVQNSTVSGGIAIAGQHPHGSAILDSAEGTRKQLLKQMLSRSQAFCAARWQAAGLDSEFARRLAEDAQIGAAGSDLRPSEEQPLVIVVGDFGSGKSLLAERLHQQTICDFSTSTSAPIPVFAKADEIKGPLREHVIERARRLGDPSQNGVAAIVDGADEIAALSAWKLLQDGRVLLHEYPRSTLLVTTRPDVTISGEPEVRNMPALSQEDALRLVNLAARTDRVGDCYFHSMPPHLREALARPLFCIIFGTLLRDDTVWSRRSEGEFLHELVDRALKPLHDAAHTSRELLAELAVRSISSGNAHVPSGDLHTGADLEMLAKTGLVVFTSHRIGIALPILTQWFAAQALLSEQVRVGQVFADPTAHQRWEYPIAIAAGQLTSAQGTNFLKPLVGAAPEIAPGIVDKAANQCDFRTPTALKPIDAGRVLRECMSTWAEALGPLTHKIVPVTQDGHIHPVGIMLNSTGLTAGFYDGRHSQGDVVVFESWPVQDQGWYCRRWTSVSGRGAWAWRWTLDYIRGELKRHLQNRTFCTGCHPLNDELAWYTACVLTGARLSLTRAISVEALINVLRIIPDNQRSYSRKSHRSRCIFPRILRDAVSEAVDDGRSELIAPYATSDREPEQFVWDGFSDSAVLERATKVFDTALRAYRVMVETHFSAFAKRMNLYNLMPARIVGNLNRCPSSNPLNPCGPGVQWYAEPLSDASRTVVDFDFRADQGLGDLKYLIQLCGERRPSMPWLNVRVEGRVLDVLLDDLPALELAHEWVWRDLQLLEWQSDRGSIPKRSW